MQEQSIALWKNISEVRVPFKYLTFVCSHNYAFIKMYLLYAVFIYTITCSCFQKKGQIYKKIYISYNLKGIIILHTTKKDKCCQPTVRHDWL